MINLFAWFRERLGAIVAVLILLVTVATLLLDTSGHVR